VVRRSCPHVGDGAWSPGAALESSAGKAGLRGKGGEPLAFGTEVGAERAEAEAAEREEGQEREMGREMSDAGSAGGGADAVRVETCVTRGSFLNGPQKAMSETERKCVAI
jgi:hypothetical protein